MQTDLYSFCSGLKHQAHTQIQGREPTGISILNIAVIHVNILEASVGEPVLRVLHSADIITGAYLHE